MSSAQTGNCSNVSDCTTTAPSSLGMVLTASANNDDSLRHDDGAVVSMDGRM